MEALDSSINHPKLQTLSLFRSIFSQMTLHFLTMNNFYLIFFFFFFSNVGELTHLQEKLRS